MHDETRCFNLKYSYLFSQIFDKSRRHSPAINQKIFGPYRNFLSGSEIPIYTTAEYSIVLNTTQHFLNKDNSPFDLCSDA